MALTIPESIGPFRAGDAPVFPSTVTIENDDVPADLSPVTSVLVTVTKDSINLGTPTATVVGDEIVITWTGVLFTAAGVHNLTLTLNHSQAVTAPFVVEAVSGWHSMASARAQWRDAPDDVSLFEVLEVARIQCIAYAPALSDTDPVPVNYRAAQLIQARNLWNSAITDPSGQIGDEGYSIRPFPMDWTVKNMLRPKTGVPVIA